MDELEKKIPDDFWRKAFEEADEIPPPRVWHAIEHRLDESNRTKLLPLWGAGFVFSRPLVWGMGLAATVALLLVGWWMMHTPTVSQQSVALEHRETSVAPEASERGASVDAARKEFRQPSTPSVALAEKPAGPLTSVQPNSVNELAIPSVMEESDDSLASTLASTTVRPIVINQGIVSPTKDMNSTLLSGFIPAASATYTQRSALSGFSPEQNTAAAFERLAGKSHHWRDLGTIQRIVWFQPAEASAQPEKTKSKQKPRAVWASLSVMPGSFNPMVSVQTGMASVAGITYDRNNTAMGSSQQSVNSRANFSVAYQASAGVHLSERWSIESGIGYLAGRSTVEAPAQVSMNFAQGNNYLASTGGNVYVDALQSSKNNTRRNSSPQASTGINVPNLGPSTQPAYGTAQALTNDYQYVQMPVQVGYQLRPRKRLGLALIGGLITNIFVRNTVSNEVVVTAKDGVYRPVSLAASMGARLRYQPSGQWSASLAGVYQPSLGSATQAQSQVQSRPTTTGMTVGVDYNF